MQLTQIKQLTALADGVMGRGMMWNGRWRHLKSESEMC